MVMLQLIDRSIKCPRSILEDVLTKVDKFIFLEDFIVLDMEEDKEILIILWCPFLAIGKALINVQKGKLTIKVQDQLVTFYVFQAMKIPNEAND